MKAIGSLIILRRQLHRPVKPLSPGRIRIEYKLRIGLQHHIEQRIPERRRFQIRSVFDSVCVAHHAGNVHPEINMRVQKVKVVEEVSLFKRAIRLMFVPLKLVKFPAIRVLPSGWLARIELATV